LSRRSPFVIELSEEDRARLEALTRKGTAQARMVERARIVLAAAAGMNNSDIAEDLGIALNTVIKWRKRFFEEGLDGLKDRKRSGRPRRFSPLVVAEVKALACELPATTGVPLSKWSCAELAREAIERQIVEIISADTVWRILTHDAIKRWLHRSWIFPRDPDFVAKAAVVLDL
jgi:transposase